MENGKHNKGDNMKTWLRTFIEEKEIDLDQHFEIQGQRCGNIFTYGYIVETIEVAPAHEQKKIRDVLVQIDFANGDVRDFLRHLGKALAL